MHTLYGQSVIIVDKVNILDVYTDSPNTLMHGWINMPGGHQLEVVRLNRLVPWRLLNNVPKEDKKA